MRPGTRVHERGWPQTVGVVVAESSFGDGWLHVHWDGTPEGSRLSYPPSQLVALTPAPDDREACRWCGGLADPSTTCPRSIECPHCHAGPGAPCKRPSGHRAAELHGDRIRAAELLDVEELLPDPADHEVDCECSGCTELFRPEDAAYGILEAERWAAEHEKGGVR